MVKNSWLETRVFRDYYPIYSENGYLLPKDHEVKSNGFKMLDDLLYEYSVESPSTPYNERKYVLPFSKFFIDDDKADVYPNSFIQGQIGESLLRIITMEFLRQNHENLGIKEFSFSKGDFNPKESHLEVAKSKDFVMKHISRYNVVIQNRNQQNTQTEYDGVINYVYDDEKKGVIICEAKTGDLGILCSSDTKRGNRAIRKKIIEPVQSLFSKRQIDYLLMAHKDVIFQSEERKILRPGIGNLYEMLSQNNIGLILFTFNESKDTINSIADRITLMNKALFKDGKRIEDHVDNFQDQIYIEKDNNLICIKARRIEKILRLISGNRWITVYEK